MKGLASTTEAVDAPDAQEARPAGSPYDASGDQPVDKAEEGLDSAHTAFRKIEKKYKLLQLPRRVLFRQHMLAASQRAQITGCDNKRDEIFRDVIDFRDLDSNTPENREKIHAVVVGDPNVSCFTFASVPGLLIFSGVLTPAEQQFWCREAIFNFGDSAQHENIFSTHAKYPRDTTCYQPPMRWATLGFSYQWSSKTYQRSLYSKFPCELKTRMESLIQLVAEVNQDQWHCRSVASYQPQTAIVNYYPVGSAMMAHQDLSEKVLDQPLVSISLGCSAIFLMGTESRNDAPHAFFLHSGDVAALVGPARVAYHAVPRILDDCPDYLTIARKEISDEECSRYVRHMYYQHSTPDGSFVKVDKTAMTEAEQERYWRLSMRHMRINLNARQVYPDSCDFLFG